MRGASTLRLLASTGLLVELLGGCGLGTAGITAAAGGGGGSGNSAPSVSAFRVEGNRETPAQIRFTVSDAESDPATIEFCYQVDDGTGFGPPEPLTQIEVQGLMLPVGTNPVTLPADRDGEDYTVDWSFPMEAELPDDGSFMSPVRVIAIVQGGVQVLTIGVNGDFGMGNDPPVVTVSSPPPAEVSGIVPLDFNVSDSSGDLVSVLVEYDLAADVPDAGWQPATSSGSFLPFEAPDTGVDVRFFWDTEVDLEDSEVRIRYTPNDGLLMGDPVETPTFRVDNNAEPLAVLDEGQIIASPDRRRGIPLPFQVNDEEGDVTQVVVQWRRPEESFHALPSDPAEIRAILADPEERRVYGIATEYPSPAGGTVVPIAGGGGTAVRLQELGSTASRLLADGIVGRELEILRRSKLPVAIAAGWTDPLQAPVAALALDGPHALVLEGAGAGWRLTRRDLGTGEVLQAVQSSGSPDALAFESGRRSVLVASDVSGTWRLERVDLATGGVTELVSAADGSTERGRIRGLASLGGEAALITVASSLIEVRYPEGGPPEALALSEGLATPWGVVVDPNTANRVYLAERDAPTSSGIGRVSAFALDSRAERPVVAPATAFVELARPSAIAFEPGTARLLAITDSLSGDGRHELRGVELGAPGGNAVFELAAGLPGEIGGLATGADGLRIVALTGEDDLAAGGGVEQVRTILTHDPATETVEVDRPFAPPLSTLTPWRVTPSVETVTASRTGTRRTFVWDSSDLEGGGRALFRLTPFDSEMGIASESIVSKEVLSPFELAENALVLGGPGVTDGPVSGLAVDLDGDGDLDLVSANAASHALTIFYQDAGVFRAPVELPVDGLGACQDPRYYFCFPLSVAAGDLDGDGDLDLVTANNTRNDLTVFFQPPGGFVGGELPNLVLGGDTVTRRPTAVVAADLDGDGDLDLVSANGAPAGDPPVNMGPAAAGPRTRQAEGPPDEAPPGAPANPVENGLTIFFQVGPGVFDTAPVRLGSSATTRGPRALATADLDGDGDLDLVSANAVGNDLTVFLQPAGGFVDDAVPGLRLGDTTTTNRPRSVTAADLDQDGDLDLVSANLGPVFRVGMGPPNASDGSNLTIFFQTSPGAFDPDPTKLGDVTITQDPSFVVPCDLDGDGDLDLAATVQVLDVAGNSSNLVFYYQTEPGSFSSPRFLGDSTTTGSPAALVAADLDGDGGLDLVTFNSAENLPGSGNDLSVLLGVEAGRPDREPVALGDFSQLIDVQSVDLDGDGDLDLLTGERGFGMELSLFSQRSPGVFDDGQSVVSGVYLTSQAVGDLDGDGRLDVMVGDTPVLGIYLQSDSGGLVLSAQLANPHVPDAPFGFANDLSIADLNGDGLPDLLSAGPIGPNLAVFFQSSPGAFDPAPLVLTDPGVWRIVEFTPPDRILSFGPSSVVAADLDDDGDLDLASENAFFSPALQVQESSPGGSVTLFLQTSPGAFGDPTTGAPTVIAVSSTRRPGEIDAADLDGDGDVDLFTANSMGDDLSVYYQEGPGQFPSVVVLGDDSLTNFALSVEAADLDRDGDLDLISANRGRSDAPGQAGPIGSLTIFEQTGVGTFDAHPVQLHAPNIVGPSRVEATDLDGDGELDLIVGDTLGGRVTIFYGGRQ